MEESENTFGVGYSPSEKEEEPGRNRGVPRERRDDPLRNPSSRGESGKEPGRGLAPGGFRGLGPGSRSRPTGRRDPDPGERGEESDGNLDREVGGRRGWEVRPGEPQDPPPLPSIRRGEGGRKPCDPCATHLRKGEGGVPLREERAQDFTGTEPRWMTWRGSVGETGVRTHSTKRAEASST